mgnify:FL=1
MLNNHTHITISTLWMTIIVLILVINDLSLQPAWLIPTHKNSKLLLMSRYTTVLLSGTDQLF